MFVSDGSLSSYMMSIMERDTICREMCGINLPSLPACSPATYTVDQVDPQVSIDLGEPVVVPIVEICPLVRVYTMVSLGTSMTGDDE